MSTRARAAASPKGKGPLSVIVLRAIYPGMTDHQACRYGRLTIPKPRNHTGIATPMNT